MVDVLVIGGGNAALCAALMAREAGASVLLLEGSPREWRGGNSQHTRNLRCMHDAPQDVLVEAYPEEEFWQDLLKVTGGRTDEALARLAIRASATCRSWMVRHGVRFQPSLSGALHIRAHECLLLWAARQGPRQRLLPQRRGARRTGSLRPRRCAASSCVTAPSSRPGSARSASRHAAACSPPAASNRTANGCARPGGWTNTT